VRQNILKIAIKLIGIVMIANGLWMVARAIQWFFNIPADMPATGEPNGHLIRDVGFAYLVFGIALMWSAQRLQSRRPVLLMVSLFLTLHALGHVVEILIGLLPHSHWWIDLPLVFLPALFFLVLAIPKVWLAVAGPDAESPPRPNGA